MRLTKIIFNSLIAITLLGTALPAFAGETFSSPNNTKFFAKQKRAEIAQCRKDALTIYNKALNSSRDIYWTNLKSAQDIYQKSISEAKKIYTAKIKSSNSNKAEAKKVYKASYESAFKMWEDAKETEHESWNTGKKLAKTNHQTSIEKCLNE